METTCTKLIAPGLIDSLLKLRALLVFCRHPQLRDGIEGLRQRLPGNHWALEEALDALAEAGLIERARTGGHWEYALTGRQEQRSQLALLATCFDDPHRREEIYTMVRAAEQERRFHEAIAERRRAVGGDVYEPLVI